MVSFMSRPFKYNLSPSHLLIITLLQEMGTNHILCVLSVVLVKVHMNQCILSGIQSPWWYQLEFIEKPGNGSLESGFDVAVPSSFHRDTGATESEYEREKSSSRAGKFRVPRQNYEVQLCDKDTVSCHI